MLITKTITYPYIIKKQEICEWTFRIYKGIAISFYKKGLLGLGKASELAEMNRFDSMRLLAKEGVNMNYDIEEFNEDLKTTDKLKNKYLFNS